MKTKYMIDSYYDLGQTQQSLKFKPKFLTPSKIILSAKKQSLCTTNHIRASKTRSSISVTQPNELLYKYFNDSSIKLIRNTQSNINYFNHSKLINQIANDMPQTKNSLLNYQKLYEISHLNSNLKYKESKRSKSKQNSSLKDRNDNKFDQTFMKIVNPKFNQKLKILRKIHIKTDQSQLNNRDKYTINIKTIYGICQSPGNRQGCAVLYIDKKLYVIGGKDIHFDHSLDYLDCRKNQWMKTSIKGYQKRSFHSCFFSSQCIYMVCGYKQPRTIEQQRKLASDLEIINLKTKGISKYKMPFIFKRYKQQSVLFRDSIIIIGGIDQQGVFIPDGLQFSLKTKNIYVIKLHEELAKGIINHCMCEGRFGVYLFGGVSSQQSLIQGLFLSNSRSQFKKQITFGKCPPSCLNPYMQYIQRLDGLVIYCGIKSFSNPIPLKQLFIFSETKSTFTQIIVGQSCKSFGFYYSGSSTNDGNDMIIFGGNNEKQFNQQFYRLNIEFM